jgi:hypothetical protein
MLSSSFLLNGVTGAWRVGAPAQFVVDEREHLIGAGGLELIGDVLVDRHPGAADLR